MISSDGFKIRSKTIVLDQNAIVDVFYQDIPISQRKLIKVKTKRPQQSTYREIPFIHQNDCASSSVKQTKIQIISSICDTFNEESLSFFPQLSSSYSSSPQNCSFKYNNFISKDSGCQSILGKRKVIDDIYQIETIKKLKMEDTHTQIKQNDEGQDKVLSSESENITSEKKLQRGQIRAKSKYERKELYKIIKQEQDFIFLEEPTKVEDVKMNFGRILVGSQDGRVFERLSSDAAQSLQVEWENEKLIEEIQEAQQSLIYFLNNQNKLNSLSQHLSILNKCILLTSSASVGKEVDQFLSTLNQFKFIAPSNEIQSCSSSLTRLTRDNSQIFSQKTPQLKPNESSFSEVEQGSRNQSNATSHLPTSKQTIQTSLQTIEIPSEGTHINLNSQENSKSLGFGHSYCSSLFHFKIKDTSLLNQFNFAQMKKRSNQKAHSSEEEEEMELQSPKYQQNDCLPVDQKESDQFQLQDSIQSAECCKKDSASKQSLKKQVPVSSNSHNKYGKFHNYNKLFMYNILNMFSTFNLYNFSIPENIQTQLQSIISKLKVSAKRNSRAKGKFPFNYFSHAHYNVLFLQLTQFNIKTLKLSPEIILLYQQCLNIDLREELTPQQISYANIIKAYFYSIFMKCINIDEIQMSSSNSSNSRIQYTIKVVKGIQKLAQGIIIKRF